MKQFQAELELAKSTAVAALHALTDFRRETLTFGFDQNLPKEMKATADRILEEIILAELRVTGFNILSEETGLVESGKANNLRWVVDPLDGTVNFVRQLAPCSVSLALCSGSVPIFGVIGEFPSCKIAWGGAGLGAYYADTPIKVSGIARREEGIICTGIPSRFNLDEDGCAWLISNLNPYAKVRMFGAASLSLLHVARGSAEVYSERDIMFWDVAAGLAIVEGAGGCYNIANGRHGDICDVYASNGLILSD